MPSTNRLGSKVGLLTKASTSPLRGSIATSARAVAEQLLDHQPAADVDRQHQVVAGRRGMARQRRTRPAGAGLDLLEAGGAVQLGS